MQDREVQAMSAGGGKLAGGGAGGQRLGHIRRQAASGAECRERAKILTGRVPQNGLMAVLLLALLCRDSAVAASALWQGCRSLPFITTGTARCCASRWPTTIATVYGPAGAGVPAGGARLLLHEDRWPTTTPALNPVSLMRGLLAQMLAGGKMQGDRPSACSWRGCAGINTRTSGGKLLQCCARLQLELSLPARYPEAY